MAPALLPSGTSAEATTVEAMWLLLAAVLAGAGSGAAAGVGRDGVAAGVAQAGSKPDPQAPTPTTPPPRAGDRQWRRPGLAALALALVAASAHWPRAGVGTALQAAGYAVGAGFGVLNRRHPGAVLVSAGLIANLLVVALNGGMPVSGLAAGVPAGAHHHGLGAGDRLAFLADDVVVPVTGERVSAGDLLVALGGAVMAFSWAEPAVRAERAGRRGAAQATPGAG